MGKLILLAGAALTAGAMLFSVACTQETHITGPDCFAKAESGGGPGGTVGAEGASAEGAAGASSKAESGCSGAGVATK